MIRKRLIKSTSTTQSTSHSTSQSISNSISQFNFDGNILNLDKFQQEVVKADIDKHIRIIACAGSGKTTTILCRIKYLIDAGVDPKRIILTTFNIEAADNLKKRLIQLLTKNLAMRIGTFDSISAYFYFRYFKQDKFIGVNEYSNLLFEYLQSESGKNILDLYDYVFFDEFQDINEIQFKIINEFYKAKKIITVIGDDAQNIYQWRGSNISYILNFDKIFENTITFKLENNYRSTPEIIALANNSIKNNTDQIEKNMLAHNPSCNKKPKIYKYKNSSEQAQSIIKHIISQQEKGINLDSSVIIARNNFSLKLFEEEIEIFNKKSNERKIDYIALISDNDKQASNQNYKNKLCLATIHKIKGAEWDIVYLIDLDDKYFPSDVSDIGIQEERRLFYVAVTRARKELFITFQSNTISRFIRELDRDLYEFPEYNDKYFSLQDERNVQFKIKVTEIIGLLNENDLQELRKLNIIPSFNPKEIKIHEATKIDKNIANNNLYADYGIYIDTYISRQFGLYNKKSGGLENSIANCVINSIQLNSLEFAIYCEFKLQSKFLLYSNLNHNEIESKILNILYNDDVSDNKISIVRNIIIKIFTKAKKINVKPHEIYITKTGFLPQEFNGQMKKSYDEYTSEKEISRNDIYNISLCQNVYSNRKRLLYRNVFEYFDSNKDIYDNINIFVDKYKSHQLYSKYVINDNIQMISGELDLYDVDTKKIIDYKTSTSNLLQLDWILQLLAYTSLIRLNTKFEVKYINIYNPLSGLELEIDISDWKFEKELLAKLIEVRNKSLDKEKLNIISSNKSIPEEKKTLKKSRITVKTIKNEIKDYSGNITKPEKDLLTGLDLDILDIYNSMKKRY